VAVRSPMIELTMHADNAAREFYRRAGFERVEHCVHYVATGAKLGMLIGDAEGGLRSLPSDLHTKL